MTYCKIVCHIVLILLFLPSLIYSNNFPELTSLDNNDVFFQQISNDIQNFYRAQASGNKSIPKLTIYQYRVQETDSLFSLSASLNIPQSSIATINRLDTPNLPKAGSIILIPNIPGMFIPEEPLSDFEIMLSQRLKEDDTIKFTETFSIPDLERVWHFISDSKFTSLERKAFLQVLFQDPLPQAEITSTYGLRESPFTGKQQFHFGIDLFAPKGTVVKSTLEGTIYNTGYDPVYGIYIQIKHPNGYESLYAHLEKIYVEKGDIIKTGQNIGEVGSSGLSTGSHLHFEILFLGKNRDPKMYIRKK